MTSQFVQPGRPRELREAILRDPRKLENVIDDFAIYFEEKGFSASVVPTMLSSSEASNFSLFRPALSSDRVKQLFLTILCGIQHGNYVLSLENVDENTYYQFRERLRQNGLILKPQKTGAPYQLNKSQLSRSYAGRPLPLNKPSILAFAFLNYFVYFGKVGERKIELEDIFDTWRLTDTSTLIVTYLPPRGEKGEIRMYSRLSTFLTEWYANFFEEDVEHPDLGLFISSLYISDRDYCDISSSLLEKFVHQLLSGHISGEILDKLITLKTTYCITEKERKRKKTVGSFSRAKKFFANLEI
jgi:hypothetical protein